MSKLEVGLDEKDLLVVIPNSLVGMGEPGDPLTAAVVAIIHTMAELGFGPLDFGEAHEGHMELWFMPTHNAKEMADHFIAAGGDV